MGKCDLDLDGSHGAEPFCRWVCSLAVYWGMGAQTQVSLRALTMGLLLLCTRARVVDSSGGGKSIALSWYIKSVLTISVIRDHNSSISPYGLDEPIGGSLDVIFL